MESAEQTPFKQSPRARAGNKEDPARSTVFRRMRELRKQGRSITPSPIALPEVQSITQERTMPTYESLFEFAQRTGLPAEAVSALIESGEITHIRLETTGPFVQVRKGLADLERLERAGRSQRSVA